MTVWVVLAFALLAALLVATGVLAGRLVAVVRVAASDVRGQVDRIAPLLREVSDELAVTQTELEALQRDRALQKDRA